MSEKQLFRIKKTQDILNSLKVLFLIQRVSILKNHSNVLND